MLVIGIPANEVAKLKDGGVEVRVNGHPTVIRLDGEYLVYTDENGMENECRILAWDAALSGDTHFTCASHGEEAEYDLITVGGEQ